MRLHWQFAAAFVFCAATASSAIDLHYEVDGILSHYFGDEMSLDGGMITFSGDIDSDTVPFFALPDRAQSFEGKENSPATVQVSSTLMSNGLYTDVKSHPISVGVRVELPGNPPTDMLEIWHNGVFDLLGPDNLEYNFGFAFIDFTGAAFDELGVPGPETSLDDFQQYYGFITYETPEHPTVFGYRVEVTALRITPEPATLAFLVIGALLLLLRRRRPHAA